MLRTAGSENAAGEGGGDALADGGSSRAPMALSGHPRTDSAAQAARTETSLPEPGGTIESLERPTVVVGMNSYGKCRIRNPDYEPENADIPVENADRLHHHSRRAGFRVFSDRDCPRPFRFGPRSHPWPTGDCLQGATTE